ncbi:non-specific protein-tyrosine kinase [Desulfonatronum thiosulfatophilum]|uniref:non-specific protein-tyrosine kinase n=1 Tax=Desulfonatronum thiosulfatophilum TaxID=617002 RepID=A0A1G6EKK9_9BACT|nr:XrtA-associated tyrosine autokinase [Desulfonatronum thiosulfatophilum]SDB57937.1 non-specific protein-tyrosine kinase [Desulfonatronum thiosulfatophilum]
MSRIEQALEKAAKMRLGVTENQVGYVSAARLKPTPPQTSPEIFTPPEGSLKINNPTLVAATNPQSPMAEEYRKLKEMVIKLTRNDLTKNTLMVTSSMVGEGKTTTALNLAISLAQEYDHTVLLIDADLRRPCIMQYLGLDTKPGLTDCLLEKAQVSDVLVKTGIGKLTVLPSGRKAPNPGELFSSRKMRELVREMKHRYAERYIIIDTPPVLPFAETRSLSGIVDGVIMVVKSGLSTLENIRDAQYAMSGAHILGLVYNHAKPESLSSSYSYYYKNDYVEYGEALSR